MGSRFPTEEIDRQLDKLREAQNCRQAVETLLNTNPEIAVTVLSLYVGKLNFLQMLGLFVFAGPVFVLLNLRGRQLYRELDRAR